MIKGLIYQKDVTTINIQVYDPNNRAPHYMKQKLTVLKGK